MNYMQLSRTLRRQPARPEALPETRIEVLEKYFDRLAGDGVVQIKYGEEFISSSLVLATDEERARDRRFDLDGAQDQVFFDPSWGIYWRYTGCFD